MNRQAPLLLLLSEVLQRGMAKILLAPQVLDAANQARLDPLRRRPLHALGRRPCVILDALPEPFAHLAVQSDEGRADIATGAALSHECEGGLAGLPLDAEQIELADRIAAE